MRRSLLFLSALFLLSGCESEFDKCMNAELPRAEAGLRPEIEEAEKHLAAAETLRAKKQKLKEILKPVDDWIEQNPVDPPYPSYNCDPGSENWDQCIEVHDQAVAQWETDVSHPWIDRRDARLRPLLPELQAAGFEVSEPDEVLQALVGYYRLYHAAIAARGRDLDCWGREVCEEAWDFYSAEREHLYGDDLWDLNVDLDSDEWDAWEEAAIERTMQHFTDKIASIKANAPEIATLTCNRAGIYE
jgi:hypothetical protein